MHLLETTGAGAAILDFDNDGDNDIFLVNGSTIELDAAGKSPRSLLYRNDGDRFVEVGERAGITRRGWGQGACVGDFDNDGYADLAAGYLGGVALYRNNGDGTFSDVAADLGLPAEYGRWRGACAFLDYDRDGRLDLFFSSYVDLDLDGIVRAGSSQRCIWKGIDVPCGPSGLPKAANALFRNTGDGFEEVSEAAGILAPDRGYGLGVVAADFNNDGWIDIYVACDMTPSLLFVNQHDGTFAEAGSVAGVAYNFDGQLQAGMGVAVGDHDGNGFLDILKTNFSGDLPSLYNNEDGAFFEDVAARAGLGANKYLGWGAHFLDADNDGLPDIVMVNGHVYPEVDGAALGESYRQRTLLYRNTGGGGFADVTSRAGPALKVERPSRGLAVGDLNGDGRLEVLITNVNKPPSLLYNVGGAQGSTFWIRLEGSESNRSAIGARVTLDAGGRRRMQQVVGGGSYFSQSDLALQFGLGDAKAVDRLEVRWPNGAEQAFEGLKAGARYRLVEGSEPELLGR